MTKKRSQSEYKYKYLALDVKGIYYIGQEEQQHHYILVYWISADRRWLGHSRIYLENVDEASETKKPGMKMFGVTWR